MLYSHEDMDSLHILPLAVMPLQTRGLQNAKLVKNSQFRSVVELFSGEQTGSGQIEIGDLGLQFEALKDETHPDLALLTRLGELPSYDVFSLRVTLREAGIRLAQQGALKLSSAKEAELADFMRGFNRNLIMQTFSAKSPSEYEDEIELIAVDDDATRNLSRLINPDDPDIAYKNLARFAERLDVSLEDLPKFLEDLADMHLSIAYYESCYKEVARDYNAFAAIVADLTLSNSAFQDNAALWQKYDLSEHKMVSANTLLQEQRTLFDAQSRNFWNYISANRFRAIEKIAKTNHVRLGGILCGMKVKMDAWREKFPSPETARPSRVAEYIMAELTAGLENLQEAA